MKSALTYRCNELILGVFRAKMCFSCFLDYKVDFVNQVSSHENWGLLILNCSAKWHECCAKRLKWHFGGWILVLIQFAQVPCVVVVFVEWKKFFSAFVHVKRVLWLSKVQENAFFVFLKLVKKTNKLWKINHVKREKVYFPQL